jgi:hypothetical protein
MNSSLEGTIYSNILNDMVGISIMLRYDHIGRLALILFAGISAYLRGDASKVFRGWA